jgi:GMP synthase (glutamine-hydrolysing)
MLAIVKAGSTFERTRHSLGDFEDWTARFMGVSAKHIRVLDALSSAALPQDVEQFSGAVITGSHSMVSDRESWSVRLGRWVGRLIAKEIPVLGICYGHQLLAHVLGGEVNYHPKGLEIGTVEIVLSDEGSKDVLLGSLPKCFYGHVTHSQTVLELPAGAVNLAGNDFEPHHAFRVGNCAWGVQFHPEYSREVMASYIDEQAESLRQRGRDAAAIRAAVRETPEANGLLRRFVDFTAAAGR